VVSGDFYWVGRIDNVEKGLHKHFVALVDCTGHGVPGGFMSMICSSLLNQEILEKQSVEPARILSDLDLRLRKALRQSAGTNSDGMDMALCMYEYLPDGSVALVFAGAKRPLFYYSRDIGEVRILKVGHRMLGGTGHRLSNEFEQVSLILKQGDHIYLSSDGFIDQNGPKHKRLGTPKFLALLNEIKDLPLDEQGAQLRAELDKRQQGFEQRDDISLIGFSL
jgi:serine phosphatase RsbU (regulator of sigma subunit)